MEDQGSVRKLAVRILERAGYRVLEAAGGGDALGLAASHAGAIDLLLTDVVMPGVTGPELAKGLAATRPLTKLLYMSGRAWSGGLPDVGVRYIASPSARRRCSGNVHETLELSNQLPGLVR